ncbi:MAG: hypothetical protein JXR94_23960, partial [Candidatus Hydrogenedentes bacterium]|nr:hypothetical protein [Candidatus Hydrogenedentota bacterium]
SAMSGMYGVVYTDLVQFALAMVGSIGLAIIVYIDMSKGAGLHANLESSPAFRDAVLRFMPDLSTFDSVTFTFLVFIFINWWSACPGSGYAVQRVLATKSEKDSFFAFLWYTICHYLVRPWPWIIVGVCSLCYFPELADSEASFPSMIDRFLPMGFKGIMVASLLAAFMSTLDTHLNWGVSYLINDFYEPYVKPGRAPHHYVRVSRICMILLTLVALVATLRLEKILNAYKYLGLFGSGIGTVMIARWYWWRVNPWSEISAIATSLIVGNTVALLLPDVEAVNGIGGQDFFGLRLVITIAASCSVWIPVTLLTSRRPGEQAKAFYNAMRIGGPGWRRVRRETGVQAAPDHLGKALGGWVLCSALMLALLVGVGKFLLHEWIAGLVCAEIACASAIGLRIVMKGFSFGYSESPPA